MKRGILLLTLFMVLMACGVSGVAYAQVSRPVLQIPSPQHVDSLMNSLDAKQKDVGWWEMNQTPSTRFRPTQLIAPAAFISIGALGVAENAPLRGASVAVNNQFRERYGGRKMHFDDYLQYLPVGLYLTMDFMGLDAKHTFGERVAVAAVTYLSVTALSQSVKYIVREPRPDTGTRNSFPSGHTVASFEGGANFG